MPRCVPLTALLLAVALNGPAHASSYVGIFTDGSCDGQGQVQIRWRVDHDVADTAGTANWYGFDVYRRSLEACAWVRVTAAPIPWIAGPYETNYSITEAPPVGHASWEYEVKCVDIARNEIQSFPFCECYRFQYVSCPAPPYQTPISQGTVVVDVNGFTALVPCADSCYPAVKLGQPPPPGLDALAGTGTVVRLYGSIACSFEGCLMYVTSFDLGGCAPTTARSTSWGRIKLVYR